MFSRQFQLLLFAPSCVVAASWLWAFLILSPRSPWITLVGGITFFAGLIELFAVAYSIGQIGRNPTQMSKADVAFTCIGALPAVILMLWFGVAFRG